MAVVVEEGRGNTSVRAFGAMVVAVLTVLTIPALASAAPIDARGSAKQVYATGVEPASKFKLVDRRGRTVGVERSSAQGGVLFRDVRPGSGYRVTAPGARSKAVRVFSERPAPPSRKVYDQEIPSSGYGYMRMRDGTKLSYYVHPPSDITNATGLPAPPSTDQPTPTLIEYSGYGYADPDGPESGISIVGNLMGFTVVDVNMRGTGCSGGAYDFFEPMQSLDGYDVIETVARQPWVKGNEVGMMGISYGGISQLFTAALNPPSLAAITPLSVIDQTQTTLYPGGILNTGFALQWAKDRVDDAKPASAEQGQPWAYERIQNGDATCEANQALHGEAVNLLRKIERNDTYRPKVADPLSPKTFVDKIKVPVFMACQWTDEQTGGHCPTLASNMTGTDKKWFTFTNGTHPDSLDPETANRWFDFLQLYVAKQAPAPNSVLFRAGAPLIYQEAMGIPGITLPPDPIQAQPTYEAALAAFEELDPVRILFDNGAGGANPGEPYPGYERSFSKFPLPGTEARSWTFGSGGELRTRGVGEGPKRAAFRWDAGSTPLTNFTGDTGAGGLWNATPDYDWKPHPERNSLSYTTTELKRDTTVVGAGAVQAWVRSSRPDVDLQATISEIRPDGKETFVQGGWARASARKLDRRKSTPLEPVLSLRERDLRPMPRGRFVKVTIPLYYQGHAYREGSRIRVVISAPNGDQPIWAFERTTPESGRAKVEIRSTKRKPSRLKLPVIRGLEAPTELPPCPGLRGQPCRAVGSR
ncbi:CocE/NonD family hydrolase [Thermoleophilia bacterium SCSIO 60948]|nr:CocE/NonD family hydrolase [Thermoleophilia bacterium SCSIO 60948]